MMVASAGIGLPALDEHVGRGRACPVSHRALDDDALSLRARPDEDPRPLEGQGVMEEGPDRLVTAWDRATLASTTGVASRPRSTMSKRYPSAHSAFV